MNYLKRIFFVLTLSLLITSIGCQKEEFNDNNRIEASGDRLNPFPGNATSSESSDSNSSQEDDLLLNGPCFENVNDNYNAVDILNPFNVGVEVDFGYVLALVNVRLNINENLTFNYFTINKIGYDPLVIDTAPYEQPLLVSPAIDNEYKVVVSLTDEFDNSLIYTGFLTIEENASVASWDWNRDFGDSFNSFEDLNDEQLNFNGCKHTIEHIGGGIASDAVFIPVNCCN